MKNNREFNSLSVSTLDPILHELIRCNDLITQQLANQTALIKLLRGGLLQSATPLEPESDSSVDWSKYPASLTVAQVSELLGPGEFVIRDQIRQGRIPRIPGTGRHVRVSKAVIRKIVDG